MNSRSSRHTPARPGAAVHRPVAVAAPATAVAAPITFAPNAALLIDFDNVTMGIRSDLQSELRNLLASDIIKGKVQLRRAYADWRRYPQYVAPLAESSIDMIMAPAYGSSKKNATDIRLAIDALELVFTRPEIGTYILLSGDSDFSTLVIKLKEYGKYVIGVGIRESSSDLLVMNCDEYYSYNSLAGLVRAGEEDEPNARHDPWELVSQAIARMQRNGDVMRADRLKQVMQDIDSSFDEKNLGMSKFSRFVQEAAQRGLVSLTKLDSGQLEVGPPHARASSDGEAAGVAPAGAGSPELVAESTPAGAGRAGEERGEERGRRGRRGGRGRGREREGRPARAPAGGVVAPSVDEGLAVASDSAIGEPVVAALPRAVEPSERAVAGTTTSDIGLSGERLTRDEAFDLVRRAVGGLVSGEEAARASDVRSRAFSLLGRDSESLSDRNFSRILRDAHDADVIDLRRRGDDYEVALAAAAAPVADQLNVAAAARGGQAGPASGPAPSGLPAARRGLGPRGRGGARRGGLSGRPSVPSAELLSVGVVDIGPGTSRVPEEEVGVATQPAADVGTPDAAVEPTRAPAARRGRSRAKRSTAEPAHEGAPPKAKRARARSAAKTADG
jgi:uncharacterized LabA/DUF88 family protein